MLRITEAFRRTSEMSLDEIFGELGEHLQARFVMTQILNYITSLHKLSGSFNYNFQVPELPKLEEKIQRWGTVFVRGSKVTGFRQKFRFWYNPCRLEVIWVALAGQVVKLVFEQGFYGWKLLKVVGATEQVQGNLFMKLNAWMASHGDNAYHTPLSSLREEFN